MKFFEAKQAGQPKVTLWGTGSPKREFLYVDDLAEGLIFIMNHFEVDQQNPDKLFLNVGVGQDLCIRDLAIQIKGVVGYPGDLEWDSSIPDGTPRKLLDVSRLAKLGWQASTSLQEGIERTLSWYQENKDRWS
jgi:GDP-L-fucose synthase